MQQRINPRPVVLLAMILAAGLFRIITTSTHSSLAGFTPLGAMALFAGFYFMDKKKAYLTPLLTIWLSDIILNRYVYFGYWVFFYDSCAWVYASFALLVLTGQILKTVSIKTILFASASGAIIHWLVADFGVWLNGCNGVAQDNLYTPDLNGLLSCYSAALPSLGNFVIGNLIFSTILFGTFELMKRKFPALQLQPS